MSWMAGWFCGAVGMGFVAWATRATRRPTALLWLALLGAFGLALAVGYAAGRGSLQDVDVDVTVDVEVAAPAPTTVVTMPGPTTVATVPGVRSISETDLQTLVLDLRGATFPHLQLSMLRGRATAYTFTPTQATRVLLCFTFDDQRLGALEVLSTRIDRAAGPMDPVLNAFSGPFGSLSDARLILGLR